MLANSRKKNLLHEIQARFFDHFSNSDSFSAFIETIVLTGLGFLLGYWFLPESSLFAVPGFTWLVIGPLLSGLRYGFFYALLSVVLSIVALLTARFYQLPWVGTGSISTIGLVLLWMGFITSGFRSYWERQVSKLTATSSYLNQQLSEITKAHSLTKISHDRLQELVVSQISLRDTILEVRKQIIDADINLSKGYLGDVSPIILRVLSDYGDVQLAGLHQVDNNQEINTTAVDHIGNRRVLINPDDPLLKEAIETRKTVSLKRQLIAENKYTGSLILAIPLVDSTRKIWGIVAVYNMPFRSYRPDNLKLISTLAGYIGDLIGRKNFSSTFGIKNTELHSFLLQVQRCILDISSYDIPSAVFGFEFENKETYESVSKLLLERKRGLDQSWSVINRKGNPVMCFLLPLTSEYELMAYKTNLLKLLKNKFSIVSLQSAGILFHEKKLSPDQSAADVIDDLADKLHVDMSWTIKSAEREIYAIDQ